MKKENTKIDFSQFPLPLSRENYQKLMVMIEFDQVKTTDFTKEFYEEWIRVHDEIFMEGRFFDE